MKNPGIKSFYIAAGIPLQYELAQVMEIPPVYTYEYYYRHKNRYYFRNQTIGNRLSFFFENSLNIIRGKFYLIDVEMENNTNLDKTEDVTIVVKIRQYDK